MVQEKYILAKIISSPQARAVRTAEINSEFLSIPIEFDRPWQAIHNCNLTGLLLEEAAGKVPFPETVPPYDATGESGTNNWHLYRRVEKAVQEMVNQPAGNHLVVLHGGLLNSVLSVILGFVPKVYLSGVRSDSAVMLAPCCNIIPPVTFGCLKT